MDSSFIPRNFLNELNNHVDQLSYRLFILMVFGLIFQFTDH